MRWNGWDSVVGFKILIKDQQTVRHFTEVVCFICIELSLAYVCLMIRSFSFYDERTNTGDIQFNDMNECRIRLNT